MISSSIRYICIEHQGKQDLAKSIPIKLKAFQYNPKTKFLIIHDQDSHDCRELKASLLQICQQAGSTSVLIRIVCRELESWFLGDLMAIEKAYQLKPKTLSQFQNQRKYRDPDRLNSAKKELKSLVNNNYYPGTHSKVIAPYLSLEQNRSHSFRVFLEGLKKYLEN